MANRWPWWPMVLLLAAVILPGATSARSGLRSLAAPDALPPPPPANTATAGSEAVDASPPAAAVSLVEHPPSASQSLFDRTQVISLYGYPGVPAMGDLGKYSPDEAAAEVARVAAEYDALNGARGAVGALHVVVSVAHPVQTADGSYLTRLDTDVIATYVEAARKLGGLLILDTPCGTADPVAEAERLEPFLKEPFVHLALDPEFAMRASGGVPGDVIGSLDSSEVNAVQRYLAGLVRKYALPPKMLVVHQFRDDMLTHSEPWENVPEVLRTINVDGWGDIGTKLETYDRFALAPWTQHPAIKLFDGWDVPLMTPEQVLALPRQPDLIVYQ